MTAPIKRAIRRGVRFFLQTYDVVCRWGINYPNRITNPECPLIDEKDLDSVNIRYAVPSMHIESHVAKCAKTFGLKRMDDVGHVHGEGVEHPWRDFNKLRPQVREMGWGGRRDFMNDHIRHWNWQKVIKMGEITIFLQQSHALTVHI